MNTSVNKANISAVGPWIALLIMEVGDKFELGFTEAWYVALASLIIWVATFFIPNAKPPVINPNLKSAAWLALIVTALVMLSGCSMMPYYPQMKAIADGGIAAAVDDRKSFNDKKLDLWVQVSCDHSVGAVARYGNKQVQDFVMSYCGLDGGVTSDQLRRFADIIDREKATTLPTP